MAQLMVVSLAQQHRAKVVNITVTSDSSIFNSDVDSTAAVAVA